LKRVGPAVFERLARQMQNRSFKHIQNPSKPDEFDSNVIKTDNFGDYRDIA
jgi:hypothetical protein